MAAGLVRGDPRWQRDATEASAEEARAALIERVAELDEELLEAYMENSDVSEKALVEALRRTTISSHLVPVFCGSSLKNKGVQPLLDAVVDYLPSPLDVIPLNERRPLRTWQ